MPPSVIEHCFEQGIPFAMAMWPGSKRAVWYGPDGQGPEALAVRTFELSPQAPIAWLASTTPEALAQSPRRLTIPAGTTERATDDDDYRRQAASLVSRLKAHGGKTVLSRLCVATGRASDLTNTVMDYFGRFPQTLRFVFQTDESGLWMGASPELLIDYDSASLRLDTMSLAGTRDASLHSEPWDEKNIDEHRYVTDYILATLRSQGLEPEIVDSAPLRFGEIEHLCDRIRAHGPVDAAALADALSPTPALCGYPKAEAYSQILGAEQHRRLYYGGWVALRRGRRFLAHVVLRCARVLRDADATARYMVYAGGGLTAHSDVETELAETYAKAQSLLHSIVRHGEYQ